MSTRQAASSPESPAIPRYAWVILFVVFLASVAAPLNQNKVPPVMPVLRDAFQLNLGQAGSLMSVFAITGLILALPTGIIMQRLGPKVTGLAALACLVIGASMGALAPTTSLLLLSRVIEGIGMGLIAVVAPAIVAMWFPREKQGTPMGIWATWVPVGTVIMFNTAPLLSEAMGWQSVWWVGAGFALLTFVLFAWLMRMPDKPVGTDDVVETMPGTAPMGLGRALANINIWLLALSFGCFNLVFLAFGTFFPTFLAEVRGYSLSQAAFIASLATFMVLLSAPVGGWLSDKLGTRKWLIVVPALVVAVMLFWPFKVTGTLLYVYMILQGLFVGAMPTATFAAVPEVMDRPEMAGIGMAVLAVGQNLGMVVGRCCSGNSWRTSAG